MSNNILLVISVSLILGITCTYNEIKKIKRKRLIQLSNLFVIVYGLTYGWIPCLIFSMYAVTGYRVNGISYNIDYTNEGINNMLIWILCAVIGYAFFSIGYKYRFVFRNTRAKSASRMLHRKIENTINDSAYRKLNICNIICLLIGVISMYIWIRGWGGLSNLIANAPRIRNGTYGVKNAVAFFAKPGQIVTTVSIISIILVKKRIHIVWNSVMFIGSFSLSLVYLVAKDGRMAMAMYFCILFFVIFDLFEYQKKLGKKLIMLIGMLVLFIIIVLSMDRFTTYLRTGTMINESVDNNALGSLLSELKYIYISGQTAVQKIKNDGSPFLILHDIGYALFAWVPSALTPKGFVNIWDYNTELVAPFYRAQIPCDMITTAIYDLSILGVVIIPMFWGKWLRRLDNVKTSGNRPIDTVIYYGISMMVLRLVDYSCLFYWISDLFHLFVAAVVFALVEKLRLAK